MRTYREVGMIGVAVVVAVAWYGIVTAAEKDAPPPVDRATIERDLKLTAMLKTPAVVEAGGAIGLKWSVTNTSKDRTHPIVLPGDGSEVGWREPHVYYTVERLDEAGAWVAQLTMGYGRCGNFDSDWSDAVRTLRPSESLELGDWLPAVSDRFEFQTAGRYRIAAHYEYRGKPSNKGFGVGDPAAAALPAQMKGVAAHKVSSEPVEVTVTRPIELRVTVKRDLELGDEAKLSDVLTAQLVNTTEAGRTLVKPTERGPGFVWIQVRGLNAGAQVTRYGEGEAGARLELAGGAEATLIGLNAADGTIGWPAGAQVAAVGEPEEIEVRVTYMMNGEQGQRMSLMSQWVKVNVVRKRVAGAGG